MRPYPSDVRRWEEDAHDLIEAAVHLDRVNKNDIGEETDINFTQLSEKLQELAESEKERQLNNAIDVEIENFVVNNGNLSEELLETSSIERKNEIIEEIQDTIKDRQDLKRDEIPNADEVIDLVEEKLKH